MHNLSHQTKSWGLLKINEDNKKMEATVMPNGAIGEGGRTNQVDMAKRSYLEALTRGRE